MKRRRILCSGDSRPQLTAVRQKVVVRIDEKQCTAVLRISCSGHDVLSFLRMEEVSGGTAPPDSRIVLRLSNYAAIAAIRQRQSIFLLNHDTSASNLLDLRPPSRFYKSAKRSPR